MINIENLKIVLYDFDDTLCIWSDHTGSPENRHKYHVSVPKNGKKTWNSCKPNIYMKKFIDMCTELGVRQGLISGTESQKHAEGKHDWVLDKYGVDLENFCVCSFEAKLDIMLAIADAYNYKRSEILIVDNLYENLERAANNGFQACTPMEVVNFLVDKSYEA